jgi:hypothetical protein
MKIMNVFVLIGILIFYKLYCDFVNLGGMAYPLLKVLMKLIILLFMMVLLKYKKNVMEIISYDKFQKKIDDYYKKINK